MQKEISEDQILKSILKWSDYLVESGEMSREDVNQLLGEGLVKRLGQSIADTVKGGAEFVGNSFKHVFGDIGKFMHDMVLANKGVEKLLKCINALKSKVGEEKIEDAKLVAMIENKVYPIYEIDVPGKWSKALVLAVDPTKFGTVDGAVTLGDLANIMEQKKIKNLSSWVEGVMIGVEPGKDGAKLDEGKAKPQKKQSSSKNLQQTKSDKPKSDIDTNSFEPIDSESGNKYTPATNQLIDVRHNGKDVIAFVFDVTEETKKKKKTRNDLFT